jgi:hypothetical protein
MEYQENLAKAAEILGKSEKRLEIADVWSVAEAVDLLVGMRPIVGEPDIDPDHIKRDMRELAYGSIDAGALPCVGKPKERRVRPVDFIRWATSKGLPIPRRMETLLGEGPARPGERAVDPEPPTEPQLDDAPVNEPAPSIESASDDDVSPEPDTRGMVAWQAVIVESWPEIAEAYQGKPTALKVMDWLKRHGDKGVFPAGQKDRFKLQWTDAGGDTHIVQKKTVDTVLSKLRKDGKIPHSGK